MIATQQKSPLFFLLMSIGTLVTASAFPAVAKRKVLSDLSGGFCRSWKFGGKLPSSRVSLRVRE
ncbi:hypothetical protein BDW68DRAFT_171734 [Aspergillus falconensis]